MATISICLIARNEEQRLPRALASVRELADEIVVVDSGSTDRTLDVAAAAGARVIEHSWQGFAHQRNVALAHATSDWVLELDADEWCSSELAQEIRVLLDGPPPSALNIGLLPMRHHYLGRTLGPAGHYPFYRSRLLRRGAYQHDESRAVHEGIWPRERPWVFHNDLHHELAGSLREVAEDAWAYAGLEAQGIQAVTARALIRGVLLRPPAKFLYQAVALGGWRDGPEGLLRSGVECVADALTWLRAARHARGAQGIRAGHFGRTAPRVGPVHLLAVGDPAKHTSWLEDAANAGALVSVICSGTAAQARLGSWDSLRIRTISRFGPLNLLRAIDQEAQLSPVDAWIALDRRSLAALRLLPLADRIEQPAPGSAAALVAGLRPVA